MKTKEITIGGLLAALSLIIPLAFGGVLGIVIPPFSATLASHVPVMLAMLISPATAVFVGIVSAIGFLIKLGPVIAARAAVHAVFGYVGAKMIQRGYSFPVALAVTLPIHAVLEAIVVIPFGFDFYKAFVVVGIGTMIHHTIDSAIALALFYALNPILKFKAVDIKN
ncbi:niacin transporter [Thermoanaerobacter uzonensis DSM 18761]|uniref:Niacin transporter n=1 Tax=Thermoanaerobacter uzonensis DSM 18761 TaxID=1123369 RepID=A0A1M4TUE2_9THEO|nr:ECF transporter S component [Thermoanaerobacter uzonensis]SHE47927.1 niacin transporter [Thermoanaerobacter uzonensis DSM 18761]